MRGSICDKCQDFYAGKECKMCLKPRHLLNHLNDLCEKILYSQIKLGCPVITVDKQKLDRKDKSS